MNILAVILSHEIPSPLTPGGPMHSMLKRLIVLASLCAMPSAPALAQNTITLEGSVRGDGAMVAGAQITVVNVATQETARTVTRSTGEFRLLGLFSGQYTVNVKALGFRQRTDTVQLTLGQRA